MPKTLGSTSSLVAADRVNSKLLGLVLVFVFILAAHNVEGQDENRGANDSQSKAMPILEEAREPSIIEGETTNDDQPQVEFFETENGIKILTSVDHMLASLVASNESADLPVFMLTVIYLPSCPHSKQLIDRIEGASVAIDDYMDSLSDSFAPPVFAKIDASLLDSEWIKDQLQVDSVPAVIALRGQMTNDEVTAQVLDTAGLGSSTHEIVTTALHLWYLYVISFSLSSESEMSVIQEDLVFHSSPPIFHVSSLEAMHSFLKAHAAGFLRPVKQITHPNASEAEKKYIAWLMSEDQNPQPSIVFTQCRQRVEGSKLYEEFNGLSHAMAQRPDVAFFSLNNDCQLLDMHDSGEVIALRIDRIGDKCQYFEERALGSPIYTPLDSDKIGNLAQFVVIHSTPTLLWYDRRSVAPMSFPLYRQVHAILFINMHSVPGDLTNSQVSAQSRSTIQAFRNACENHRRRAGILYHRRSNSFPDMVCLVVPSTETRILNTFGIDVWTPFDTTVSEKLPNSDDAQRASLRSNVPALLITDQRKGGIQRFHLDSGAFAKRGAEAVENFIQEFWNGRVIPERKSEKRATTTNESGVYLLTGSSFAEYVLNNDKHTLVYFYAPTCGHCKRFSLVWNELARLIRYMEWGDFLDLAKMDVTRNDAAGVQHLDIQVLPDVRYFPKGAKNAPIKFDQFDELGDAVGRLSDPLDILDWLLDVSMSQDALNEDTLLRLMKRKASDAK